jgi:hypothetical protein
MDTILERLAEKTTATTLSTILSKEGVIEKPERAIKSST